MLIAGNRAPRPQGGWLSKFTVDGRCRLGYNCTFGECIKGVFADIEC